MDTNLHSPLAERALHMAIQRHNPPKGFVHHSDRGVQYASGPYRKILSDHKLDWTCHVFVPLLMLVYETFRSKATGLFQPSAECRRRGL